MPLLDSIIDSVREHKANRNKKLINFRQVCQRFLLTLRQGGVKGNPNIIILMKRSLLSALLLICALFSINACHSSDQDDPLPQLETIGFVGTLPDGRTFGTKAIQPSHGIVSTSSSDEGSYITHEFSILDSAGQIKLAVELPYVKFSDSFQHPDSLGHPDSKGTILYKAIKEHYSYQVVKGKLSAGDKFVLSSQHPDKTNTFRIQMVDEKNYVFYTTEQMLDQKDSYLRVKQIIEREETDPILGKVKKIEVVFDVYVKLYATHLPYNTSPGKLKGLLRMKYLEK